MFEGLSDTLGCQATAISTLIAVGVARIAFRAISKCVMEERSLLPARILYCTSSRWLRMPRMSGVDPRSRVSFV